MNIPDSECPFCKTTARAKPPAECAPVFGAAAVCGKCANLCIFGDLGLPRFRRPTVEEHELMVLNTTLLAAQRKILERLYGSPA